jgi:hypothetical protein
MYIYTQVQKIGREYYHVKHSDRRHRRLMTVRIADIPEDQVFRVGDTLCLSTDYWKIVRGSNTNKQMKYYPRYKIVRIT